MPFPSLSTKRALAAHLSPLSPPLVRLLLAFPNIITLFFFFSVSLSSSQAYKNTCAGRVYGKSLLAAGFCFLLLSVFRLRSVCLSVRMDRWVSFFFFVGFYNSLAVF